MEKFITGTGQRLKVHEANKCSGYCPIHNPSDHHMKDWPLHWRSDLDIFERLCEHGVGHPDPDSLAYMENVRGITHLGIHGCDGCCTPPPDFLKDEDVEVD